MKNYYEILEVNKNASPEVIEKAYKTLTKKYHPDVQPADKKYFAELKMKDIIEAYNILSNQANREEYDYRLNMQSSANSEVYDNLYSENQKLEEEVKKLKKEKKAQQSIIDKIPSKTGLDFKYYFNVIGNSLYNFTKKDSNEKKKTFIALFLTAIIVSSIVFLGLKFGIL